MSNIHHRELDRIRREYARRDRLGLSKIYHEANPAFLFHKQEREWAILSFLRKLKVDLTGCSVLEVGSGTGHILQRFIDFGASQAVGLDVMLNRLQTAKERHPRVTLAQGNAAELPFASHHFDLVTQFMCLSSVLDPSMRREIAGEMWRVLRPGGLLLSYDLRPRPFKGRLAVKLLRLMGDLVRPPPRKWHGEVPKEQYAPTPIRPLSVHEIRELFPRGESSQRSVSLDFHLAEVAETSYLMASFLSRIKCLQTHYLVVIRKPLRRVEPNEI
jgi:ubiquinone/menaquinone biosynthesis C-methylase UbiE